MNLNGQGLSRFTAIPTSERSKPDDRPRRETAGNSEGRGDRSWRNSELRIAELRIELAARLQGAPLGLNLKCANPKSEFSRCIIYSKSGSTGSCTADIWGIIVLMAMESSIFPGPERGRHSAGGVSRRAGASEFYGVIIAGTVGSYLGSAITYWISLWVGRPVILRFGKFFFIPPEKLERAEIWLRTLRGGRRFLRPAAPGDPASHFHPGRHRADEFLGFQRGHDRRVRRSGAPCWLTLGTRRMWRSPT